MFRKSKPTLTTTTIAIIMTKKTSLAATAALLLAGVQATISTLDYWIPVFR